MSIFDSLHKMFVTYFFLNHGASCSVAIPGREILTNPMANFEDSKQQHPNVQHQDLPEHSQQNGTEASVFSHPGKACFRETPFQQFQLGYQTVITNNQGVSKYMFSFAGLSTAGVSVPCYG